MSKYLTVWSQIDFESCDQECFFPQKDNLKEIHEQHPNATFVLTMRPVQNWIKSVNGWTGGKRKKWGAKKCQPASSFPEREMLSPQILKAKNRIYFPYPSKFLVHGDSCRDQVKIYVRILGLLNTGFRLNSDRRQTSTPNTNWSIFLE